jgi:hypothetical protein
VIDLSIILQALIVAGVTAVFTALVTGYVNSKIVATHLSDLTARIVRIEQYLNGLLEKK